MPCQDCAKPTTSHFPVTSLASRIAASFASPPVDSSITRGRSGTSPASASASATTGSHSIEENRWSSRPHRLAHRRDDLRMRMAEDRAHLAGGEIQHPPARRVVQERALGAHRHERHEVAAIAQHVAPRALPEPLVRRLRHVVHPETPAASRVTARPISGSSSSRSDRSCRPASCRRDTPRPTSPPASSRIRYDPSSADRSATGCRCGRPSRR